MRRTDFVGRHRIADERTFRLTDLSPGNTWKLKSKVLSVVQTDPRSRKA